MGGLAVYWNADVQLLSSAGTGPPSIVAAVAGLTTVEVLQEDGNGGLSLWSMPAPPIVAGGFSPCMQRTPLALGVLNIDSRPEPDVLVEDACGNYVVQNVGLSSGEAVPWDALVPASPAYAYLQVRTDTPAGQAAIVHGSKEHVEFLFRDDRSQWVVHGLEVPRLLADVARTAVPLPDDARWLVQAHEQLWMASPNFEVPTANVTYEALVQASVSPPNLVPYEAFDHLHIVRQPGCPPIAIGVCSFPAPATGLPRPLCVLSFSEDVVAAGTYEVHELQSGMNVTTLGVIQDGRTLDVFIGVLGIRNKATAFAVYRMSNCEAMEELGEVVAEFDYRTASTPGFGTGSVIPRTTGAKLLGYRTADVMTYAHYDGYELRCFRAAPEGDRWRLWEDRIRAHDERSDLSVP